MIRVKICGITRLADAQAASEAGADAVGFIFAKSPRRIKAADAAVIAGSLGPWITKVGVFVNEPLKSIEKIARSCGLDAIQLHGDERPEDALKLRALGFKVIKAVRLPAGRQGWGGRLKEGEFHYPADALLLDTAAPGVYGGSGKSFDWRVLGKVRTKKPVIVSGGLNAENVRRLLQDFTPYGVDVSSGVESTPGKKDPVQVRKFIQNVKTFKK